MLETINELESGVRGYVRLFPTVFDMAVGSELFDIKGKRYVDFFCGAGTLNYGHNNPKANEALVQYIQRNGIQHGLDTATKAKIQFLDRFQSIILAPRQLNYRVQFAGPTGTNAVEAALKLARKQKQRSHVIAFTHAYHGHSLGSLSLTANRYYHSDFYGSRNNVSHVPYDGYLGEVNTADLLDRMLDDPSSGLPLPAAIILETVQGEGGIVVASDSWLRQVEAICRKHNILLIVDDIQVGNGRTGAFFSFEQSGISPDIVCLSKSIAGGLPMSLVLMKPEVDVWKPGEHTGTFRGNNLAFVAAAALLEYWNDDRLVTQIAARRDAVCQRLSLLCEQHRSLAFNTRGRGLIQGLDVRCGALARRVINRAFESGLVIEASGAYDEVLKIMPALTISESLLQEGLDILTDSLAYAIKHSDGEPTAPLIESQIQSKVTEISRVVSVAANPDLTLSSVPFVVSH
jgi:diaminobutyrate-2-oxoglutarate transaminase